MGAVVGEMITAPSRKQRPEAAADRHLGSGGARMMEGVISLMQWRKSPPRWPAWIPPRCLTSRDDRSHHRRHDRFVRHAGRFEHCRAGGADRIRRPRVIEQTIRQKLPEGFQRSEFLLQHGMLDAVVHRRDLKSYISRRSIHEGTCRQRRFSLIVLLRSNTLCPSGSWTQFVLAGLCNVTCASPVQS